jgi:hypothetical protein
LIYWERKNNLIKKIGAINHEWKNKIWYILKWISILNYFMYKFLNFFLPLLNISLIKIKLLVKYAILNIRFISCKISGVIEFIEIFMSRLRLLFTHESFLCESFIVCFVEMHPYNKNLTDVFPSANGVMAQKRKRSKFHKIFGNNRVYY